MSWRPPMPAYDRFTEKFEVNEDGCWEWRANKINKGYGVFRVGLARWLAHRFSFVLHRGAIPEGKWVLHSCDIRACVNPDHLFLGDGSDNMIDMHSKGRGRSILDPVKAREIMRRRRDGELREVLAAEYGVSPYTVKNIDIGRTWTSHMGGSH